MPRKEHPRGVGAPPLAPSVAEMRALAHPLRLRILELFAEAPRTTKQIADLLGQPPTRLYHHVAALERAGLLRLKETRKNRGTVEKWYESIARTMGVMATRAPAGPKKRGGETAAKKAMAMAVLEQSRQEVVMAMAKPDGAPLLARLVMVAPPHQAAELRKRIYDFLKDIQREYDCDDTVPENAELERWAMTMTFAPVWPRGG